ncbi:MAG: TrbI/VirB10 family protein [Pseudomonadota bacterium]
MTDKDIPPLPKAEPESLMLRAAPRRVVRFKRNLLIGIAAVGAVAITAAIWFALGANHSMKSEVSDELYNVGRKPKPNRLASLPSSYDKVKLGPPLPGDLGPSVVARERSLGISATDSSFKPNPADDAARAEQIRLAQQARQATDAGVFFLMSKSAGTGPTTGPAGKLAEAAVPGITPAEVDKLNLDLINDQNGQGQKLGFVNQKDGTETYNPHTLQKPASPYELLAGSVISASLITGVNSDLPGMVVAQVTENLYDTATGQTLLVPQGSRLIGSCDSVVAFGQSRALLVWQRIIMPDGSSIQIDNLPATDAAGYSGLEDDVDYHTWTLLKGVALSTLLGVGGQLAFGNNQSNLVEAIRQSTLESTNQADQKIVEKDLNIQPTITVRPGWPLRVVVHKDLILKPYGF